MAKKKEEDEEEKEKRRREENGHLRQWSKPWNEKLPTFAAPLHQQSP